VGCGSSFGPGLRRWEGQRPVLGTLGKWSQAQLWKAAFGKDCGRGGQQGICSSEDILVGNPESGQGIFLGCFAN
jgi:hypothetical protein